MKNQVSKDQNPEQNSTTEFYKYTSTSDKDMQPDEFFIDPEKQPSSPKVGSIAPPELDQQRGLDFMELLISIGIRNSDLKSLLGKKHRSSNVLGLITENSNEIKNITKGNFKKGFNLLHIFGINFLIHETLTFFKNNHDQIDLLKNEYGFSSKEDLLSLFSRKENDEPLEQKLAGIGSMKDYLVKLNKTGEIGFSKKFILNSPLKASENIDLIYLSSLALEGKSIKHKGVYWDIMSCSKCKTIEEYKEFSEKLKANISDIVSVLSNFKKSKSNSERLSYLVRNFSTKDAKECLEIFLDDFTQIHDSKNLFIDDILMYISICKDPTQKLKAICQDISKIKLDDKKLKLNKKDIILILDKIFLEKNSRFDQVIAQPEPDQTKYNKNECKILLPDSYEIEEIDSESEAIANTIWSDFQGEQKSPSKEHGLFSKDFFKEYLADEKPPKKTKVSNYKAIAPTEGQRSRD